MHVNSREPFLIMREREIKEQVNCILDSTNIRLLGGMMCKENSKRHPA